MDFHQEKCVIVLDEGLPAGVAANTAAILGITLGQRLPGVVGEDQMDRSGCVHLGIIGFPVPILRADAGHLKELRQRLEGPEYRALTVADFSDLAQGCRTYEEFTEKMGRTETGELTYLGLALCGPKKQVNKLTGSLPLLR